MQSALQNSGIVPDVFDAVDFDNEVEMSVEFPTGIKVANGNDIPKDKAKHTAEVPTALGACPSIFLLSCAYHVAWTQHSSVAPCVEWRQTQTANSLHGSGAGAGSAKSAGRGGQGAVHTHRQRSRCSESRCGLSIVLFLAFTTSTGADYCNTWCACLFRTPSSVSFCTGESVCDTVSGTIAVVPACT
jgi:hypothetical protein